MRRLFGCCSPLATPSSAAEAPCVQDVETLLQTSTLSVLKDVTRDWKARRWNLDWLDLHLGDHEAQICYKNAIGDKVGQGEALSIRSFLRHHEDFRSWAPEGLVPYFDNLDIEALTPTVREDCPSHKLFGSARSLVIHGAFLGPAGSTTRLHVDSEDNLIFCCFGRKCFILLPPESLDLINFDARAIPLENPWDPALEEKVRHHPLFARCADQVRVVVLTPGDLLVQPKGWSHWVINLELSFSIACWAKACPLPENDTLGRAPQSHIVLEDLPAALPEAAAGESERV